MIKLPAEKHRALTGNTGEAIVDTVAAGLVDTVAPLDRIAAAIVRSVREGGA
jgi:hypothetical protein